MRVLAKPICLYKQHLEPEEVSDKMPHLGSYECAFKGSQTAQYKVHTAARRLYNPFMKLASGQYQMFSLAYQNLFTIHVYGALYVLHECCTQNQGVM